MFRHISGSKLTQEAAFRCRVFYDLNYPGIPGPLLCWRICSRHFWVISKPRYCVILINNLLHLRHCRLTLVEEILWKDFRGDENMYHFFVVVEKKLFTQISIVYCIHRVPWWISEMRGHLKYPSHPFYSTM